MCGIIGEAGIGNVAPALINGLKMLEYRGYDSAGIAVMGENGISRCRAKGRVSALAERLSAENLCGKTGIGHTRWATHGAPDEKNAHPHIDKNGKFALVHNGIIENSEELKAEFLNGFSFSSETDTEVAAKLLGKLYKGDAVSAISQVCRLLEGSFAFGILCEDFPDAVFACAKKSPLLAVKGKDASFIVSDIGALHFSPSEAYRLSDGEICVLTAERIEFYNESGESIKKIPEKTDFGLRDNLKNGYEHFMLKEIFQQPDAVGKTLDSLTENGRLVFSDVKLSESFLKNQLKKISLIACGSAYHAGLSARPAFERLAGVPCEVFIASEYRYSPCFSDESTLAVFVSQSGETADTIASLRLAAAKNAKILSIVNVSGSALTRESENVILTMAGQEIAVATTKAFSAQLAALYAFSLYIGRIRERLKDDEYEKYLQELYLLPEKQGKALSCVCDKMKEISAKLCKERDVFYIGRLGDYAIACEGSLKMKEITYINSQAYPSGELKHGTISLIDKGTPVIAIASSGNAFGKNLSNISEVVARGARAFIITDENEKIIPDFAEDVIRVPSTISLFQGLLSVVPLQLLSYYTAKLLGRDIDKPKNLAKSVTVE